MGNAMSLAASIAAPIAVSGLISVKIAPEIKTWYPKLKKPSWNPPNWLFAPVWTVLYGAMGVASHRVWKAGGGRLPLALYAVQLGLNFAYTPLFFGAHNLKAASMDSTALLGALGATIYEFNKVDKVAARLLVPYLGWTAFATALTYNIWLHNDKEGKDTKQAVVQAGDKAGEALAGVAAGAESAARQAGGAVAGVASSATALGANVFLAQGGETQADVVPPEAAAAISARVGDGRKEK